jgi:Raf kinase inhibitor-like YbhB/YbcL family protein
MQMTCDNLPGAMTESKTSILIHFVALIFSFAIGTFVGIRPADAESSSFVILSNAFQNGATIPEQFSCSGLNQSPPLVWSGIPEGTKSLALIVSDPDAPRGTFVHWVAYDIPANVSGLPQDASKSMPGSAKQGVNGAGKDYYFGPCPPPGKIHHYHFVFYALDSEIEPAPPADAAAVTSAMSGHIKATTDLVGTFSR